MSYDIVIIHGVKDSEILPYTIQSIKNLVRKFKTIYIISQDPSIDLFKREIFNDCVIIDEKYNAPCTIDDVNKIIQTPSRNGWYLQQILKLYASFMIPEMLDQYVVIDSDTIFLKHIEFFMGESPIFNLASENHTPYFEHMKRLHPSFGKKSNFSGVAHHMPFDRRYIKELMKLVCPGEDSLQSFWKRFLSEVDIQQRPHSGASEYELYFNYMLAYHKQKIQLRRIHFENTGIQPHIAIQRFTASDVYYISIHSWMRPQAVKHIDFLHFGKENIEPFNIVSGERLQECCDLTILTSDILQFHRSLPSSVKYIVINELVDSFRLEDINMLKDCKSVFVYTHILDLFVKKVLPMINNPIILMTHNSDHPINDSHLELLNNDKILKMYSQNTFITHPKLISLPIGIANNQWQHGNKDIVSKFTEFIKTVNFNDRKNKVYVNFTIGTFKDHRSHVYNTLKSSNCADFVINRDFVGYFSDLITYKWVACPRGNGIDTHRLWEALYAGCIPLVDRSVNSESFYNLPIIYIDNWEEVNIDWLEKQTEQIIKIKNTISYNVMDMSFWENQIPKHKNEGDFVLVYIGKLPSYTEDCIKQIRLWNPTKATDDYKIKPNIYLCTSRIKENIELLSKFIMDYSITPVFIEDLEETFEHKLFNQTYTNMSMNGFWKYTTERFFIVEECMRKYNLENIFHLEIDNLVYFNFEQHLKQFKQYNTILIPSDNETRFIAGVSFINQANSLRDLNSFFAKYSHNQAEMEVIMKYNRLTNRIKTLPTIMKDYPHLLQPKEGIPIHNKERFSELTDVFEGIFDAAAIGQYMFGIDPIHDKNNTDGFVNPHCCFQIDKCSLKWEKISNNWRLYISCNQEKKWFPVYNLHIHNKSLHRGLSDTDATPLSSRVSLVKN